MTFFATPLPTSVDTVADLATSRARTRNGGVVQTAGYSEIGDGGGNQYAYRRTGRSMVTIDNGLYIAGSPGLDDYFEILDKSIVNVASFGANESGLSPTEVTARIQLAIAAMNVGPFSTRELRFTPGHNYQINNLVIDINSRIKVDASNCNFFLNVENVPGFTVSAVHCDWNGGMFFNGASNPLYAWALDFRNSSIATSMTAAISNIKSRDVYRFMRCFTDRSKGVAYRFKINRCDARTTIAGHRSDPGCYGIRLDGTVPGDSSGNDTDITDCKIVGHYTNVYTNGAFTKITGGSVDGAYDAGVTLDGAAHFSSVNTYFEYNKYHFRYVNSPYQPRSFGCSYTTTGTTAFSIGSELSVGSSHLSYGDNNTSQVDTHKSSIINASSGKGLEVNVANSQGTAVAMRHNASGVAARFEVTSNGIFEQFDKFHIATVDAATNTFTVNSHGMKSGENVRFEAARGSALPTGMSTNVAAYQIGAVTTNTFTLEPLGGGPEVDIADAGSGTWYVVRNYGRRTSIGSMSVGDKLNGIHTGNCHGFFRASTPNLGNTIFESGRESIFDDPDNTTLQIYSVYDPTVQIARNAAVKIKKDNTSGYSAIATGAVELGGIVSAGPCLSDKPTGAHGFYRTPTGNQGNLIAEIGRDTYVGLAFGRGTTVQFFSVDDANIPIALNCAQKVGRDAFTDVSLNCSGYSVTLGARSYYGFADKDNNDLGFLEFVGTVYTLGTQKAGTGVARNVAISREGVTRILVTATGLDLTGTVAVTGAMAVSGPVELSDILRLDGIATPADPPTGKAVIWVNAAGDVMVKSNVGGTTKTGTLLDYASMT